MALIEPQVLEPQGVRILEKVAQTTQNVLQLVATLIPVVYCPASRGTGVLEPVASGKTLA